VRREVGDHRAERSAQRSHIGRDRAAAGSRGFARRFIGEFLAGHVDKTLLLIFRFKQVFDHLLLGAEGLQIVQSHRLDGDADDLLLGDTRRTALFAQEVASRLDKRPLGHETHDLRAGDAHPAGVGPAAHLVEGDMQGRHGDIGQIHRDLRDAVLLDIPPDGLRGAERAGPHDGIAVGILHDFTRDGISLAHRPPLLAHVESDGVGAPRGGGVEIEIDGNQEIAGPDRRGSRTGHPFVEGTRPEIGGRLRVRQLLGQRLVLSGAADGQVPPLGPQSRSLVAIGRNPQFAGDAFGQPARQRGALLERDARNGNERQDVGGPHAGVRPFVAAHVDQFGRPFHPGESRLDDLLGRADEGDDRAVRRFARIDVQDLHAARPLDRFDDPADHLLVASLAEIGDALHDSLFHIVCSFRILCFKYNEFPEQFR